MEALRTTPLQVRAFPAMDGIRGIAAILVALFHFRSGFLHFDHYPAGDSYLAVDLFFVLSGFVLAHAYEPRFAKGMTVREFMRARLIRLYPLYLVGLLLGAIVIAAGYERTSLSDFGLLGGTLLEAFMLPVWTGKAGPIKPIDGALWSLLFEFWVNLLFVISWPRLTNRNLFKVIALTGALFLAATFYRHQAHSGPIWKAAYGGIPRTIFSFSVGVLICRLRTSGRLRIDVSAGVFSLAILVLIAYLVLPVSDAVRPWYDSLFIFAISPCLVVLGTSRHLDRAWVATFTFLGSVSYALYVIHGPIQNVVKHAVQRSFETPPVWTVSLVAIAALIVVSYLLDMFYDTPVRRVLSRRFR